MERWREVNFDGWSRQDVVKLHRALSEYLDEDIEIDLEKELMAHYHKTRDAYDIILGGIGGENVPNGLASVASAVTKVLADIANLRSGIRTAEAFDELVSAVITVLEDMDTQESLQALDSLRERLKGKL